jgi:hypothetical protein
MHGNSQDLVREAQKRAGNRSGFGAGGLAVAAGVGLGDFLQFELHHASDLELDGLFGGHGDAFHGAGVLGEASGAVLAFKDAEIAKFEAVALAEFQGDIVKELLDDAFDDDAFEPELFSNAVYEFFFCNSYHDIPLPAPGGWLYTHDLSGTRA